MQKFTLILDLKNDPQLIEEYENIHKEIPAYIAKTIKDSGITKMEIFRFENRMVMHIEANDEFSFDEKSKMDANDPKVVEWETRMAGFQQIIPGTKAGEKWVLAKQIFDL